MVACGQTPVALLPYPRHPPLQGKRVVDLHQLDWRRPVTEPPVVPKPRVPQQPTAADIAAAAVTAAARAAAAAAAAAATAAEPGGADAALWDVYEKV